MLHRRFALAVAVGSIVFGGLAVPIAAGQPVSSATPAAQSTAQANAVTLPTGDRVTGVGSGAARQGLGVQPARPTSAGGAPRAFSAFNGPGGDTYVVPAGTGAADESQFDVTALAYGRSAAKAVTPPGTPMYTLTIKSKDRLGAPVGFNALADVQNVDNRDIMQATSNFYKGQVSFSVPSGHYNVVVSIQTSNPDGSYNSNALVVDPQVTVSADTTITLNAKQATTLVPVPATPRPATYEQMWVDYVRLTPFGQEDINYNGFIGGTPIIYVSPTTASDVTIGSLHFYTYFRLNDPGSPATYTYDIENSYEGAIPATLPASVAPQSLATIDDTYYSDVPNRSSYESRVSFLPWETLAFRFTAPLTAPVERTEYVSGVPDVRWVNQLYADAATYDMITDGPETSYQPGQQVAEHMLKAPLHPDVFDQPDVSVPCGACRQGNQLQLNLTPWDDAQPGAAVIQVNGGDGSSTDLKLYQNGALVGEQPVGRNTSFDISSAPADYQLELDATKEMPWSTTSATSTTRWSFSSAPGTGSTPAVRTCADGGHACDFVPLLLLEYDVPVDQLNTIAAAGPVSVGVTVRHQLYEAGPAGVGLTFQVSFDDGATWTPATVADQANGQFRVTYNQPAAQSGFVSFRATATDATGASVEQTITRAYQRAASSLAAPPAAPAAPLTHDACPALPTPYANCMAVVNDAVQPDNGQPAGYGPADIASAYQLPTGGGRGQTVAIVDAMDDPNAEADLAAYRAEYGLPPCTTANGCFTKVNQRGDAAPLPSADPGWGLEISLDLDMVSAVCPNCAILLVEGDTPLSTDLGAAVNTAVNLGADVVSNSYGTYGEPPNELTLDKYYRHPGHAIVAAAGDYGYNASYPAVSSYVTAVGGTTLSRSDSDRGWSETAWSGTGGGCSAYERKPNWQHDPYCGMRMMNDVAAVADPRTGVAVYDTFNESGWVVVGGTSASTPIIGAGYALAGNAHSVHDGSLPYQHPDQFNDVIGGSNTTGLFSCGGDYICTAVPGYDGPTGLGTPNGVGGL